MVRFTIKFGQNAKIREKVGCSANMCCNGGRHPPTAGAELKILIFGAGGSSIRPLGTISGAAVRAGRLTDANAVFPAVAHGQCPNRSGRLVSYTSVPSQQDQEMGVSSDLG